MMGYRERFLTEHAVAFLLLPLAEVYLYYIAK